MSYVNPHLLDLQAWDVHAAHDIGEEGYHVVVAHGHVRNNLLQGRLLRGEVLVLLSAAVELKT